LMGSALGGGWWFLAAVLVVPLSVNVVNFMDGINGITSLTIACWGVTALLVGNADRIPTLALIGAVTAGASLGFLPWNAPVARIFLGDVGSYLLGGLVASGTLIGIANGASSALLLAPMTLFAVDTGTVLARRVKKRQSAVRGTSGTHLPATRRRVRPPTLRHCPFDCWAQCSPDHHVVCR